MGGHAAASWSLVLVRVSGTLVQVRWCHPVVSGSAVVGGPIPYIISPAGGGEPVRSVRDPGPPLRLLVCLVTWPSPGRDSIIVPASARPRVPPPPPNHPRARPWPAAPIALAYSNAVRWSRGTSSAAARGAGVVVEIRFVCRTSVDRRKVSTMPCESETSERGLFLLCASSIRFLPRHLTCWCLFIVFRGSSRCS